MPEVWCAPGKIHLRCEDETKVLWKPLLTQNPAMGSSELLAQLDFAGSTPHFRLTAYRQGGCITLIPRRVGWFSKFGLNKIAARWPAKAVAQLSFSQ